MQKILMIEDNPADVVLWRMGLDGCGEDYSLEILPDGEAALKFVHAHRAGLHKPEPCVILLDLYLPKHNGMEVLRAIKDEPALAHITVVVWTSVASQADLREVARLGAICRQKPLGLAEFEQLALEVLALCKGTLAVNN
jgi:CheY-like chemotaxis protein